MSKENNNTTKYVRAKHDKKHPYLTVSQQLIKDPELKDEELGLMIRLLANADDFVYIANYFQKKVSSQSNNKYYKSIKHLQELGYIIKNPRQGGIDWIINETRVGGSINNSQEKIGNKKDTPNSGESTNTNSTNTEMKNGESTNGDTKTLINNNQTSNKERNNNKKNNNEVNDLLNKSVGETLSNVELNRLQSEFSTIFQYDDKLHLKLNKDNTGEDVINKKDIELFKIRIKNTCNTDNPNIFEEFDRLSREIAIPIIENLDLTTYERLYEGRFELLPPKFITENNIRLSQLSRNLEDFIIKHEELLKKISTRPTYIKQKDTNSNVNKDREQQNKGNPNTTNTDTTKVINLRTNKGIKYYPTNANVSEEDYNKLNQLLINNKGLGQADRLEDMLKIRTAFQNYFEREFGKEILNVITQGKGYQIKFTNPSDFNDSLINLYENNVCYYIDKHLYM